MCCGLLSLFFSRPHVSLGNTPGGGGRRGGETLPISFIFTAEKKKKSHFLLFFFWVRESRILPLFLAPAIVSCDLGIWLRWEQRPANIKSFITAKRQLLRCRATQRDIMFLYTFHPQKKPFLHKCFTHFWEKRTNLAIKCCSTFQHIFFKTSILLFQSRDPQTSFLISLLVTPQPSHIPPPPFYSDFLTSLGDPGYLSQKKRILFLFFLWGKRQ